MLSVWSVSLLVPISMAAVCCVPQMGWPTHVHAAQALLAHINTCMLPLRQLPNVSMAPLKHLVLVTYPYIGLSLYNCTVGFRMVVQMVNGKWQMVCHQQMVWSCNVQSEILHKGQQQVREFGTVHTTIAVASCHLPFRQPCGNWLYWLVSSTRPPRGGLVHLLNILINWEVSVYRVASRPT